ncbi:hypothetical protein EDD11_001485 [Mortierella claussenii]|nr:hypothetical protein EDD11_001485 [Mortierella claussenii]
MKRDLEARITMLISSACSHSGRDHEMKSGSGAPSTHSGHEHNLASRGRTEKAFDLSCQLDEDMARKSLDNLHDLDLEAVIRPVATASAGEFSTDLTLRNGTSLANALSLSVVHTTPGQDGNIPSTMESSTIVKSSCDVIRFQPDWPALDTATPDQQAINVGDNSFSGQLQISSSRATTLSFYDDLLKSISSERMMYSSSLSNPTINECQQQPQYTSGGENEIRESHNLFIGVPSIAGCPTIPLSYPEYSDINEQISSEQAIHPFDAAQHPRSTTTLQTLHQAEPHGHGMSAPRTDMYARSSIVANVRDQLDLDKRSRARVSENNLSGLSFSKGLSRSGSSHSQETIEKWRIHVKPNSPVMPEIDSEMFKAVEAARVNAAATTTSAANTGMCGPEYDRQAQPSSDSVEGQPQDISLSRRETIPIVLSSYLQAAAAEYRDDPSLYISAADLHLPRPSYAYGHPRTQRQGSVNSSIGGYNYSVSSSPSLADSLSNPMYQQQSHALKTDGSACSRILPPRKSSLPSSFLGGSIRDEYAPQVTNHYHHQPSQSHLPHHHLKYQGLNTRMNIRAPSHLNNVMRHDELGNFDRSENTAIPITATMSSDWSQPPPPQKPNRYRSQSQGTQISSGHCNNSSWDPKLYKNPQGGYTAMGDLPESTTAPPHRDIQGHGRGLSLKEALDLDSPKHVPSTAYHDQARPFIPLAFHEDTMMDHLVHPLDLSPLLQQQRQTENQLSYFHDRGNPPSTSNSIDPTADEQLQQRTEAQAAWNETCIGLGLTFTPNTYSQHHPMETEPRAFTIARPVPVNSFTNRFDINDSAIDVTKNHFQGDTQWASPQERPNMATRQGSGSTTVTSDTTAIDLSDRTLTNTKRQSTAPKTMIVANKGTNFHVDHHVHHENRPLQHLEQSSQRVGTNRTMQYQQYQHHHQQQQQQQHSSSTFHVNASAMDAHTLTNTRVQRQPSQRNKKNLVVDILPIQNR